MFPCSVLQCVLLETPDHGHVMPGAVKPPCQVVFVVFWTLDKSISGAQKVFGKFAMLYSTIWSHGFIFWWSQESDLQYSFLLGKASQRGDDDDDDDDADDPNYELWFRIVHDDSTIWHWVIHPDGIVQGQLMHSFSWSLVRTNIYIYYISYLTQLKCTYL